MQNESAFADDSSLSAIVILSFSLDCASFAPPGLASLLSSFAALRLVRSGSRLLARRSSLTAHSSQLIRDSKKR